MQRLRILLSIALFTSAWTTTKAATFDGFVYQDLGSYVKITGYSPSTSLNVTVPATINGDPVTIIGDYAFQGKSTITQILLPDSIIEIGQHAFAFTAIESITIPDTVTTVGRAICLACGTLTEILVEPTSTSFTSIDGVLFSFDQTVLVEFPGGYLSDTYT
ncbi:MAG: leucine-rich repeat domain-containing protein, partial [Opitutales bacterium]|nr:leucine-rich repeat domain-containing protein [Opitutales bacterium]